MERNRTIHRLRVYKTPITILLFLSTVSILIFLVANIFGGYILEAMRTRALNHLETVYVDDINFAMAIVPQAFKYLISASFMAAIISIVGFLILFFYIRTRNAHKLKHVSLNLLGIGGLLMTLVYFLVAMFLPEKGDIEATFLKFRSLQIIAVCFMAIGHILFVVHVFKSIIFENE